MGFPCSTELLGMCLGCVGIEHISRHSLRGYAVVVLSQVESYCLPGLEAVVHELKASLVYYNDGASQAMGHCRAYNMAQASYQSKCSIIMTCEPRKSRNERTLESCACKDTTS
jgi:hypothetical protein